MKANLNSKRILLTTILAVFGIVILLFFTRSCSLDEVSSGLNSDAVVSTRASVTPILWTGGNGGNASCSDVGGGGWSNTSVRNDYVNGNFMGQWPAGFSVTVRDGKYVDWSFSPPQGMCVDRLAVIVKGGNKSNIYLYKDGQTSDTNLSSPVNASGKPAGLSNLTFCWDLKPCNGTDCIGETAFGGNVEGGGNSWWWYLDTQVSTPGIIYAGKKPTAGTVTYANGEITINLGSKMYLAPDDEAVKIQGYSNSTLPTDRPDSGHFTTYKGRELKVSVSAYDYYVIHLDVMVCQ